MIDLTGKIFGKWKVLNITEQRKIQKGKPRVIVWCCQCECGTIRNVSGQILRNENKPRSCGCSRKIYSKKIFESNYEKTDGCWIWKGSVNRGGYGKIGTTNLAHRRAYEYAYGKIPEGKQVCHHCDIRLCVNPSHLFLGSIGDNMKDKCFKDRQARGSKIGNAILTEEKVLEIRKQRLSGKEYQEIADGFGVGWYLVRDICKNKQWKHVPLGEESKAYISPALGFKGSKKNRSLDLFSSSELFLK